MSRRRVSTLAPFCSSEQTLPVFEGLSRPEAARTIDRALTEVFTTTRQRNPMPQEPGSPPWDLCENAQRDFPVNLSVDYTVLRAGERGVASVAFQLMLTPGAHPFTNDVCKVVDLTRGVVFDLMDKFRPGGRRSLEALVNQQLRKQFRVNDLRDADFQDASYTLAHETMLCLFSDHVTVSAQGDDYKRVGVMIEPVRLTFDQLRPLLLDDADVRAALR